MKAFTINFLPTITGYQNINILSNYVILSPAAMKCMNTGRIAEIEKSDCNNSQP